ncbi:unnamed protein product [Darwinula stevensoni]|uniref:Derlin n=1 Tax=Darwinula stevensoni TaxID=69355 RepID=A0A7R8X9E5_9CRUS|nr:unnamed protein product [Darwinula stevensoni]CAG0891035.1 unnamed protein product [Darwinula stevensoni]
MSDIANWFKSLPIVTRCWFGFTIAFTLLGRFGLLSPYYLMLLHEPFIKRFQIWRPFTAAFYYPLSPQTGFHFLINLYFLYNYSYRLETGTFDGRPADYLFMHIFNWIIAVIVGLIASIPILMDILVLATLYIWCQLNKDMIVAFWFGTQFKAMYLPWVLLAFNMIVSGGGVMELMGILIGHLYFFLAFKYPQDFGGVSLISTPQFLYNYLPNRHGGVSGFGQAPTAPSRRDAPNQGRYNWGRGHLLGDN